LGRRDEARVEEIWIRGVRRWSGIEDGKARMGVKSKSGFTLDAAENFTIGAEGFFQLAEAIVEGVDCGCDPEEDCVNC